MVASALPLELLGVIKLVGGIMYLKWNRWLGLSIVVTGFSEIVYWTRVTFLGPSKGCVPLLIHKFWFSLGGPLLLLMAIRAFGVFREERVSKTAA